MNKDLISIIVPIYNVKPYLRKCLESIINQTYNKLEVILIDDGSTDGSEKICDEYIKKDSRIKVIHLKNEGVSHARNMGLNLMKGKYFLFIDSDDYIKNNMVENLYNNCIRYNCDVSICNVIKVDENGNTLFEPKYTNAISILNKNEFLKYLYNDSFINGYPINKLIKAKCTEKIRFDERIKHLEDWDYLCRISKNIDTVVYDGISYYYYYVHRNSSAIHEKFNESWTTDLIARNKNIEFVQLYNEHDRDRFYFDYIISALNTLGLHYVKKKLTDKEKTELLKIRDQYYPIVQKSKNITKYEKLKLFFKTKFPILYYKIQDKLK